MDPLLGIAPSLFSASLSGPTAASLNPTALAGASSSIWPWSAYGSNSVIVQLSATGVVLSAIGQFQQALQGLPQVSADAPTMDGLTQLAQGFVAAFNGFATSVAGVQATAGGGGTNFFANQLTQTLDAQLQVNYATDSGGPATLAQVGINVQPDGSLALDPNALQAAFRADPQATAAVLNQAAQAFGNLAGAYAGAGGALQSSAVLTQIELAGQLLGGGLLGGTAPPSLTDLLLLESLTGGGNGTNAGALQQYAFISALVSSSALQSGLLAPNA